MKRASDLPRFYIEGIPTICVTPIYPVYPRQYPFSVPANFLHCPVEHAAAREGFARLDNVIFTVLRKTFQPITINEPLRRFAAAGAKKKASD